MNNRVLIITQDVNADLARKIQDILPDWEVLIGSDLNAWRNRVREAEVIVGWRKEMENLFEDGEPSLSWLQSWSAGVDTLPLKKLAERDILLTSANGVHAYPISETIFALMLALTRRIHTYVKNQQNKVWDQSGGPSPEMHGKTIGIIGVGAIGLETAKIAKAFGMTVLGVRHSEKDEEFVDEMYTTNQLNEVLQQCDYVVVTLPLTEMTNRLFGKEQFECMKSSTVFINIGRGEVVNEAELTSALKNGLIAGAGIDVFEREPLNEDSPLWEMENVIITPHMSGSTEYYQQKLIEDIFIPNLLSYLEGKKLSINPVNFDREY